MFKSLPSRLGTLLGMKTSDLEKIIYYQDYVVVDPGDTELKYKQVMTEDEHRQAVEQYGNAFRAQMGADAVRELIEGLNLDEIAAEIRQALKEQAVIRRLPEWSKKLRDLCDPS